MQVTFRGPVNVEPGEPTISGEVAFIDAKLALETGATDALAVYDT